MVLLASGFSLFIFALCIVNFSNALFKVFNLQGVEKTLFIPWHLLFKLINIGLKRLVGLGLNIAAFHMDIGGAVSTTTDKVSGIEDVGDVTWPTQANLGLAFSMFF